MSEYMISNIPVYFPFEPYPVQRSYMEKVIECLQNSKNGVLESPTGTGKTLSLLCSSLAWLSIKKAQLQMKAHGGQYELPGGDFVTGLQENLNSAAGPTNGTDSLMWGMPKIIYASRTHSQLSQAMQELKRTSYKYMKVSILGSRDQMCIHPEVSKESNNSTKVHMCRIRVTARSCYFYNNVEAKKEDKAFKDEGILDIEDLVSAGRKLRCCPYFLSRELKQHADIIFMPYNYLLDPKTRKTLGVEVANNVIILDEAHNIEKMCEESASLEIRSTDVALCIEEITQVMKDVYEETQSGFDIGFGESSSPAIKDFTPDDLCVLKTMFLELEKAIDAINISPEGSTYPGSFIFDLLGKAELTHGKKTIVMELLEKIVQYLATTSTSPFQRKGAGLQKFVDLLRVVFATDTQTFQFIDRVKRCYKVHVTYEEMKNKKGKADSWSVSNAPAFSSSKGKHISYWCFSPGFGMQMLMDQGARCVILTSGTLAPLKPLISELGISIPVQLENPHIITPDQVCVGILSKGPDGFPLNSSFNTRNDPKYIASLGRSILNFCRIIPHGLLVFFPSYPVMKKCQEEWQLAGIWTSICEIKPIFVEPQSKEGFIAVMSEYYAKIKDPSIRGACFMAVTRGKVSEGLDFADFNGRAVIITGLPYPPFKDPRVVLKQKYLDENRTKENEFLTGRDWYQLEASRAVNQAMGRVIRHAKDYGVILLCDMRFDNPSFKKQLSSWLQPYIKLYKEFGPITRSVREFFRSAEDLFPLPKQLAIAGSAADLSLPPVQASFDSGMKVKVLQPSSSQEPSIADSNIISSWSLKEYSSKQCKSNPETKKKNLGLFAELETRKTEINFDEVSDERMKLSSCATNENTQLSQKKRKLKLVPLNLDTTTSEDSVDMFADCVVKKSKVSKSVKETPSLTELYEKHRLEKMTSGINVPATNVQKEKQEQILKYVKEVKKALDPTSYQKFNNAVKQYRSENNYTALIENLEDIFLASKSLHHFFIGFQQFLKKEHEQEFEKFCKSINISK